MKRFLIVLCSVCAALLSFGLTACGSGYAKIVGIRSSVILPDEEDAYSSTLADDGTLAENDYVLEVGKTYNLTVSFTAHGGSKYPGFTSADGISILYDAEALEISLPEQDRFLGGAVKYNLVCKRAVEYAAIIVEVDGQYSDTVIVSAK